MHTYFTTTKRQTKNKKRGRHESHLEPLREYGPAHTSTAELWLPERREDALLLSEAPGFVVVCCGSAGSWYGHWDCRSKIRQRRSQKTQRLGRCDTSLWRRARAGLCSVLLWVRVRTGGRIWSLRGPSSACVLPQASCNGEWPIPASSAS